MGWQDAPLFEGEGEIGPGGGAVPPARPPIRTGVITSQEDPGPLGAFSIAAGHKSNRILSGIKHLRLLAQKKYQEARGDAAGAAQTQKELDALGAEQVGGDEDFGPLAEHRPVSTALGGGLPYAIPMGGVFKSLAGGATLGGLEYGTPQERATNAVTMGVLGGAGSLVGGGTRGILSPGARVQERNILTSPMSGVLDRFRGYKNPDAGGEILTNMESHGYKPSVSEIGGSTTARQAEDYLSRAPGGSGVMEDFAKGNRRAINTAAARSIGERARNLSADVLSDASSRIGATFDEVAALPGNPVALGPDVARAANEAMRMSAMRPLSRDPKLEQFAQQLQTYAKHRGRLSGEAYNNLRSDISAAANAADKGGNASVGRQYREMLDALDSSAATSLERLGHGKLAKKLQVARGEYANLMSLERGRTVTAAGDVHPQAVGGVMRQKYPRQFKEGGLEGNPLYDIGRYGEVYQPLRSGSQTFERQAIQDIAEAPAAMATGAERAGPSMVGVATAPLNWMAAQYMTSPVARFLSRRGLLGQPTLSSGGGILSEAVARDIAAGMPGSMGILSEENY